MLLCTWPFPTSSSTADPTYMLAGMMVHAGTQMGLHRARSAEDFNKVPLRLEAAELDEWARTWQACSLVGQSVSLGCGLPTALQMQDWSLEPQGTSTRTALEYHLRIEQLRYRISQSLPPEVGSGSRERLALHKLLNASMAEMERQMPQDHGESRSSHLSGQAPILHACSHLLSVLRVRRSASSPRLSSL